MSPSLALVVTIGVLVAAGVYLVLERSLTRIIIGIVLIGNGVNLLLLVSGGAAGGAPIIGMTPEDEMSDPLPEALILTAIVITLGMTAFLLALAYRSWQLHGHDEVQDDVEDRRIAYLAARDEMAFADSDTDTDAPDIEDEAHEVRDETDSLLLLVGEEGLVDVPVRAVRDERGADAEPPAGSAGEGEPPEGPPSGTDGEVSR
ncbi:MAG: Na(+)/H(+) antiporter subunit C [Actinomycetales bacterium]|nr:Na(+)/H(+) antiporter subunit C [Actinomycetales bacterium]